MAAQNIRPHETDTHEFHKYNQIYLNRDPVSFCPTPICYLPRSHSSEIFPRLIC